MAGSIVFVVLVGGLADYSLGTERECTTSGERCVFPFRFKGVLNTECSLQGSPPAWCSTKTDSNDNHISNGGHWGDCAPCPTVSITTAPSKSTRMACNQGGCYSSEWCRCPLSSRKDCIKEDWICDGTEDCDDHGEDEKYCDATATTASTTSGWSILAYSDFHSCNGQVSRLKLIHFLKYFFAVPYQQGTQMTCNQGSCYTSEWCQCPLSSKRDCVKQDWICDGTEDCDDHGEDEKYCGVTATTTSKTTTTAAGKYDQIKDLCDQLTTLTRYKSDSIVTDMKCPNFLSDLQ